MFKKEQDIFHLYLQEEYVDRIPIETKKFWGTKDSIGEIFSFLGKELKKNIKLWFRPSKPVVFKSEELRNKPYWFFVNTKNNIDSIGFIYDHFKKDAVYITYNNGLDIDQVRLSELNKEKPRFKYFFFFLYLSLFSKKTTKAYKFIYRYFNLYEFYKELLAVLKPKVIFFSNDHFPDTRALILAAKDLKIKTVYSQHASVSKLFPPLKFSLSLLDGKHAFDLYSSVGNVEGKCELTGMSKFPVKSADIVQSEFIKRIGIAFNTLDDITLVNNLTKQLANEYPGRTIILRKHPRDQRTFEFAAPNVEISDALKENTYQFLKGLEVLVSNNSGILLEAAILNIMPVQYNFTEKVQADYYGFIRHGLAQVAIDRNY